MNTPHITRTLARYPVLAACRAEIEAAFSALRATFAGNGKLLVCGNGGSAADADHIVGELMKGFLLPRPLPEKERTALDNGAGEAIGGHLQRGLPAIALSAHSALITAVANDTSADMIFAQQVYTLGQASDTLLGISTSGNSRNVVRAFQVAKHKGMRTIALTGENGGRLLELADIPVRVPAATVVEIQELHLPIYHALCAELEACFFGMSDL